MTSSTANDFSRPSNWQDFERLCIALFSAVHGTRLRRWGSAGQRKDGVDAWAKRADGRVVALRIEGRTERYGQPLAPADIDAALSEAAGFPHPVDTLLVLSAGPDVTGVQAHAAALTARRQAEGRSAVVAWGWPAISAQVGQQAAVRDVFYGREVRSSGKHKLALLAAACLIVAGGAGSLFLGKNAIDASNARPRDTGASVRGIAANLDELAGTYEQCLALLDKRAFAFSHELAATCRDPAAAQLAALSKKVDKQRSEFDDQVKAELARLLVIFHEDVREAAAVTSAAHVFDNAVVQSMKDGCAAGRPAPEVPGVQDPAVKQAGRAAVTAELRYFFLLKDFILPEMAAAREILALHAGGTPVPEQMKVAAGRMEQLLTQRTAYTYQETRWPLTRSAAKHAATRQAMSGAERGSDAAEEERWREVLAQASTQSLRGRARDIDALIGCGALKEDARSLAQPGT
jgi:hypothetical protein